MAIPNQVIIDSPTNTVEIQTNDNQLHIISPVCNTEVNVTQPVTTIIQVAAPGPQGQKGELNPNNSGSFNITGSLDISGSLLLTGNLIVSGSSTFIGPVTGNITGSLLGTASFADQATSASYALSSSYAVSASYAFNAISASYALTASYLNPIIQNVLITGSLTVSGSSTFTNIGPSVFSGSIFQTENTASLSYVTASIVKATSFTGSLLGTASFADNATSASYALSSSYAVSASYAQQATSASYALSSSYAEFASQAESASYSISGSHTQFAISASYALSSSNAISSSYAISASYAFNATSASYALSGSYVISASYAQQATSASFATTASYALNVNPASTASYALQALSASYALSGSYTQFATSASYAFQATSASYAVSSSQAARSVTASFADTIASGLNITASNLFVAGAITASSITAQSASFGYLQTVTGSAVIIGQEYIILNTQAPAARFAGLKVYDSGSNHTGSLVWDSLRNHWIYENEDGASYSGGGLMSGPRNTGSLGDETYPTLNTVLRGQGGDHLYNSNITDDDSNVRMSIPLIVTGSVQATSFTGSFSGSFNGAFTGSVSGSISAPGSTTQIVYNNAGVLAADSGLVYSGSNLGVGTASPKLVNYGRELIVSQTSGSEPEAFLVLQGNRTNDNNIGGLSFYNTTSSLASIAGRRSGANNSGALLFFTSNAGTATERLRIIPNGNIGVGLTTPSASLHISGASSANLLRIDSPASSSIVYVSGSGNIGLGTTTPQARLHVGTITLGASGGTPDIISTNGISVGSQSRIALDTNFNVHGYLQYSQGTFGTESALGIYGYYGHAFQTRQGIAMVVRGDSNNVGIGTTAPSASLHISGASSANLLRISSPASSSILFVSGSGNVGLGTSTPITSLDVNGRTRISATGGPVGVIGGTSYALSLQNNGVNTWLEILNNRGAGRGAFFGLDGDNFEMWSYQSGSINFYTSPTVSAGTQRMTITKDGNVGIGETSPGARLEVKGSGTTSATTTLRIENANSSASLEVRDDRLTLITSEGAALFVQGAGVAPFSQNIAEFRYIGNGNSLIISQQGGSAGLTTSANVDLNINPSGSGATAFLLGKQVRFINSNSNSTIALQNTGGTGQARFDFITGSTTIMSVSGSGNVGIKTTTPGVELDVVGSIRASSIMFNTTTQTNNIQTNGQNLLIKGAGGVTGITMDQTSRNVGIGISTPSASLHVSGNVLLGTETDPALFTSQVVTANAGVTTIYALPTSSYEGAFFDYTIRSGSNSRAGQIMGLWSGSSVNYTEVTTLDFGNTSGFNFGMSVSSSNMILSSSATTSGWTVRTIIRSM